MNERGREAMRHWRMWRPRAYDALDDPIAHFTELGEQFDRDVETEYAALLRENNYDENPPDGYVTDLRNDAIAVAEATMDGDEELVGGASSTRARADRRR